MSSFLPHLRQHCRLHIHHSWIGRETHLPTIRIFAPQGILSVIPLQLLSYHMAVLKWVNFSVFVKKTCFPHQGLQRWLSAKPGQVCDCGMNQELQTAFLSIFVNSLSFQPFAPFSQIRNIDAHRDDWYVFNVSRNSNYAHHYRAQANAGPAHFTDQINGPDETAEIPPKRTIQDSVNTWHTIAGTKIVKWWQSED